MVNKDYLLRMAEQFGRELAIILGLREADKDEEALIYIDDLLLKMVGLTSRFINSLSDDMLLKTLSPLGRLNGETALWIALMLKTEGEIYEEKNNTNESYYRYQKALYLFLAVILSEPIDNDSSFYSEVRDLLKRLEDYELPEHVKLKLFAYYEHLGHYAQAEDTLFEMIDLAPVDHLLREQGRTFYMRLLTKSDPDLEAGNLSRTEVQEGLTQLQ